MEKVNLLVLQDFTNVMHMLSNSDSYWFTFPISQDTYSCLAYGNKHGIFSPAIDQLITRWKK